VQVELLRVLEVEDKAVTRVGGTAPVRSDGRRPKSSMSSATWPASDTARTSNA